MAKRKRQPDRPNWNPWNLLTGIETGYQPTGQYHPVTGRPIYQNPQGYDVTERSVTERSGGQWYNFPSFWEGRIHHPQIAYQKAKQSGELQGPFPSIGFVPGNIVASQFAKHRSTKLGKAEEKRRKRLGE